MARRAQSSISPTVLLAGIALLVIAALGGYFLLGKGRKPDHPPLNIRDYQTNSLSLRGNFYLLEGSVDRRDRVTNQGQIITLVTGAANDGATLPVFIPPGLKGANIESGYRLQMVVEINKDGMPEAREILE